MIIAVTGHRSEDCVSEKDVREKFRPVFTGVPNIEAVIIGMANGVDLWAGDEALSAGLEVWAAKPWAGHGPRAGDEELYARVLDGASKVVNVVETEEFPGNWCYQRRNEWMVDHATNVLAFWSGKEKGGAWNCVNYARGKKPIRNIYDAPPF